MKNLQEMTMFELLNVLEGRQVGAFYSECLNPKTEADFKHNQSLVDDIREVQAEILKRGK